MRLKDTFETRIRFILNKGSWTIASTNSENSRMREPPTQRLMIKHTLHYLFNGTLSTHARTHTAHLHPLKPLAEGKLDVETCWKKA